MAIITAKLIRKMGACLEGYTRFVELFPEGDTLQNCIEKLIESGNESWAEWLFNKCIEKGIEEEFTCKGYRNSGYRNSGDLNSGNRNSGYRNSGNWNSGNWNSGYQNSGYRNSGDRNSGELNSGNRNSGNRNSGNWNSGNWNSGDWNSGFFNSKTNEIFLFNKLYSIQGWTKVCLPKFILFNLNIWIEEEDMTPQEKIENKHFYITGGYLKKLDYKEAWRLSWNKAPLEDRMLILNIPNFDPEVFKEISGIDVIAEGLMEKNNDT